ncbi:hypothetical protein [Dyadobacter sp. CY351]|uniref:hypothetical protein n=1 Tax=Dyadobacter sp. CY351 TaxID=2909337 RepID=UPI001F48BB1A|nr:hypothetical protein [Dyadobacter sp. CY351]MCF2520881.1 hypothetical protein [Dyadobacter sp. CY351]
MDILLIFTLSFENQILRTKAKTILFLLFLSGFDFRLLRQLLLFSFVLLDNLALRLGLLNLVASLAHNYIGPLHSSPVEHYLPVLKRFRLLTFIANRSVKKLSRSAL